MVAAAFTLTNCTQEIDTPVDSAKVPFEIVASTVDTKTVNDGMTTEWTDGDALNVFHYYSEDLGYISDGKFELSGENTFKGELSEVLTEDACYSWYAFYPYNSKIKTPANTGDPNSYTNVGSTGSGAQTQVGNNSMVHIAGPDYPLAGLVEDVEYVPGEPVEFDMTHLTSLIEFVVKNDSEAPLKVTNISFTATEDVVGTYYIDFTDIDNVVYTSSGVNYVSSVAKLVVEDGEEIAVGGTAKFYMAVKPFTAEAGETLTLLINDCEIDKELTSDVTFTAGKIKTINCSYKTPEDVLEGIAGIKVAADEAGAEGGTFVADVENAVVTYVNGNNAFIEDETAGILIYAAGHGLNVGDVLNGRISGSVKIFKNLREITAFTSSATVTHTDDIPCTVLTIEQLNADYDKYENMRIKLENVEVTADKKLKKSEASIAYYNKNTVAFLEEYNIIDATGYLGKYNEAVQFNIWESPVVKGVTKTIFSGFSSTLLVAVGATATNVAVPSSGAEVTYVSSNTAVATVDADGVVTGVAEGTTTITASVDAYNGYPAASITCDVTVTAAGGEEEDVAPVGTILWADDWGTEGGNKTAFLDNVVLSEYTYTGRIGFGENATNVTYTSDSSNNVRITKTSGTNCTGGHLWFNKSVDGELVTSAIKLYGATSLAFSHSQGTSGSLCQSFYSVDGGNNWVKLGETGPSTNKSYSFTVNAGTESIMIKLVHPSTNSKNTRVDNLSLQVK